MGLYAIHIKQLLKSQTYFNYYWTKKHILIILETELKNTKCQTLVIILLFWYLNLSETQDAWLARNLGFPVHTKCVRE